MTWLRILDKGFSRGEGGCTHRLDKFKHACDTIISRKGTEWAAKYELAKEEKATRPEHERSTLELGFAR